MMKSDTSPLFNGKLAIQQRLLPSYRKPFFDALANACCGGLSIFAGMPQNDEAVSTIKKLDRAEFFQAGNHHFGKVHSNLYFCWQSGILDWLEALQPDALIVEANPRYLSTVQAIRWMHNRNKPVIGWGLGAPPLTGRFASLRLRKRKSFLAQLDGLISYSQRGADEYRTIVPSSKPIVIATNAVARCPISPIPNRSIHPAQPLTILYVGRLQQRKRIDLLLKACANLPSLIQPKLIIVGDGPARPELELLASRVYPSTEFAGEHHADRLAGYYKMADLFVLPGTGGLAVQEAMTYGLPIIVAEGDGTQYDLVRKENGFIIPANDLTALTNTIEIALSNIPLMRKMGAESYRIACEEINIEKMTGIFIQILNYLTKK